jgi:3-hydroxybutyrate dehydrogenase
MSLKGKTAVVTGSTSGIGHGIAMALAKEGCNIIVNGLGSEKDNEKAIREVQALGVRVAFDPANMLRHNQIADMIAKTERDFGAVDILVNNAGIQHAAPVEEFRSAMDPSSPLICPAFHTRARPGMKKRKGGAINICSATAARPHPSRAYV